MAERRTDSPASGKTNRKNRLPRQDSSAAVTRSEEIASRLLRSFNGLESSDEMFDVADMIQGITHRLYVRACLRKTKEIVRGYAR
ncbi:MAG TPA: hypothetical protein VF905_01735 [Nitrospirota bacterium]